MVQCLLVKGESTLVCFGIPMLTRELEDGLEVE